MVEIKAGPELDAAVAEAIGLVWFEGSDTEKAKWRFADKTGHKQLPKYSTNLNAAFRAAERVHLFGERGYDALIGMDKGYWEVTGVRSDDTNVSAETLCLALCEAILEVAKQQA